MTYARNSVRFRAMELYAATDALDWPTALVLVVALLVLAFINR